MDKNNSWLRGEKVPNYKGGTISYQGYKLVYIEGKQVSEHRLIAKAKNKDEIVHHKDGNKLNNTPENLGIITRAEHARMHMHIRCKNGQFQSGRCTGR